MVGTFDLTVYNMGRVYIYDKWVGQLCMAKSVFLRGYAQKELVFRGVAIGKATYRLLSRPGRTFSGRCFCIGDSFAIHSSLCCGNSLAVSILLCV